MGPPPPTSPGSSPGGPTTSHKIHGVMALGSRDRSPLVYPMAGVQAATDRLASSDVTGVG